MFIFIQATLPLFAKSAQKQSASQGVPLAEKARPVELTRVCGQTKLLAENSPLSTMVRRDDYSSFILWGPPGSGKTTIAGCIAQRTRHHFRSFSAVLSKISVVKELMAEAEEAFRQDGTKTIVFIDEIHRFNKAQQDAFLPYVESGAIILIGATTENPSFEVISALLSRCHVFVLEALGPEDIHTILRQALACLEVPLILEDGALEVLAEQAAGDARKALNDLELISRRIEPGIPVNAEGVKMAITGKAATYDKRGDEHFNHISVFQKAIRGSDAQAALYWLARMLEGGEAPLYITRRLVRIASEDIGLADPQALVQAMAVKEAVHFLGMPEAGVALCQLTIYLATAPKSNSLEIAYDKARADAKKTGHLGVPLPVRNAPTRVMKELGYGSGYRYSHDYPNHYSYQRYFPDELAEKSYYTPSPFGFEKEIEKRLTWWQGLKNRQLQDELAVKKEKEPRR
jgi:putative ATPase